MDIDIKCSPSYSIAFCYLGAGESVLVESGGMAYMSAGVTVSAGLGSGGVAGAASRKLLGGEAFFMGKYTSNVDGAWVAAAPPFPGDIAAQHLTGSPLLIESGSLLAVSETVDVDVTFSGVSTMLLREGATMLRCAGHGDLLVCSYGGLQRFELAAGEHLIVDTGHLVGFSEGMQTRAGALSSLATSAIVGEGIVGVIEGPGVVLTQTRSEQGMSEWLMPKRSQNKK